MRSRPETGYRLVYGRCFVNVDLGDLKKERLKNAEQKPDIAECRMLVSVRNFDVNINTISAFKQHFALFRVLMEQVLSRECSRIRPWMAG